MPPPVPARAPVWRSLVFRLSAAFAAALATAFALEIVVQSWLSRAEVERRAAALVARGGEALADARGGVAVVVDRLMREQNHVLAGHAEEALRSLAAGVKAGGGEAAVERSVAAVRRAIETETRQTYETVKASAATERDWAPTDFELMAREALEPFAAGFRWRTGAFAVLSVSVAAGGIWVGVRRWVIRPVRRLEEGARRLGAGDLSARIDLASRDEMGALAGAFNALAADLFEQRALTKAKQEELETANRELAGLNALLESRVVEKTRALRETVEQLRGANARLEGTLAELRAQGAELLHAAKMAGIGTLAGGVAHELGNLIGGIAGCARDALEARTVEEARESAGMIQRCVERAREIIASLLSFSRRRPLRLSEVDLAAVARDALALVRKELDRAGVTVNNRLPASLPVRADLGGLQQVVLNLVTNALHATPRGGALTIEAVRDDLGVTLRVADTGPGVPEALKSRIFEPFFTTKQGRDGQPAGTGLGLSVSHGIIEEHGGRIWVDSPAGGGALFSVFLPSTPTSQAEG